MLDVDVNPGWLAKDFVLDVGPYLRHNEADNSYNGCTDSSEYLLFRAFPKRSVSVRLAPTLSVI
ncbi:hypothetical protein [Streptomyces hiroshimensis]|uniref:hypothetical protein n=1 Tax=Streptomyces hiroshimensis TaxID=66424 RepID=UPI0016723251|nr:hypothetical protein [Streptomyces hiroshimensis]